jgi:hypothetical protein
MSTGYNAAPAKSCLMVEIANKNTLYKPITHLATFRSSLLLLN